MIKPVKVGNRSDRKLSIDEDRQLRSDAAFQTKLHALASKSAPVTLIVDLIGAHNAGDQRPAYSIIAGLGISYREFEPQPIADQVVFRGCKSVPAELPDFIRRA